MHIVRERETREKEELIDSIQKQIKVEYELVRLYEETAKEIESLSAKKLLHMIMLDSKKHIDLLQIVTDVLKGEEVLKAEKREVIQGLQRHMKIEKESFDKAKKIFNNVWIRENAGLKELVKNWRDDEKKHHSMLIKLVGKTFFRISDGLVTAFKSTQELEERYRKYKRTDKT